MEKKKRVVDALLSKIVVGTKEFACVFMYIYIMVLRVFSPVKPLSTFFWVDAHNVAKLVCVLFA